MINIYKSKDDFLNFTIIKTSFLGEEIVNTELFKCDKENLKKSLVDLMVSFLFKDESQSFKYINEKDEIYLYFMFSKEERMYGTVLNGFISFINNILNN